MSASNYPNNNDDSFNSFIVTDKAIVEGTLGKTFNQNELVPVNQVKFWRENGDGAPGLKNSPLPIFSYPLKPRTENVYRDEKSNYYQSTGFEGAISEIFALWKDLLTNNPGYTEPCEVVQVVVTPLNNTTSLIDPITGEFTIIQNFRLTWFVTKNSFYA